MKAVCAVALAALLVGACVSPSDPQGNDATVTARGAEKVQPVARPAPTPTPSAKPAPQEPLRRNFEFEGALEQGGWLKGRVPSGAARVTLGETEVTFGEDGRFFAAFDRDQGPQLKLTAVLDDGRTVTRDLAIARRDWDIQRVNVARRPGGSSEAYMKRRMPELEAIYFAREKTTGAEGWRQDFIWPVTGRISGRFGSQRIYRGGEEGSYHSGIDIAPGNGVPFVAPADGVVVLAVTDFSLEGQLLIIDHGMGLNSAFLHCSRILVREGETVRQGQHIGDVGSSGRATGPHLHWSLKWRDARLDPLLFTGPMR